MSRRRGARARARVATWSALALALVALGCKATPSDSRGSGSSVDAAADGAVGSTASARPKSAAAIASARRLPRSDAELPTTSASIFFGNVEGQLRQQEARVRAEPQSAAAHRDLAGTVYLLARQSGEIDEIARAIALLSRAIELDPSDAALWLTRAEQQQTIHRFAAARKDLEAARARGGSGDAIDAVDRELDYSAGKYDRALPAIRQAAASHRTMRSVARLAFLEHELGDDEAAERAFQDAEDLIRDTSPIPVAWLDVQRGIFATQRGEADRAVLFFREALRRAPNYVAAEEHLAETLAASGHEDEAVTLYESIVARSTDPEFKGALAALYRARGRTADADELARKAKQQYEKLIEKYPEAMAAHATEFYLGEGRDPRRAVQLATNDVKLRPTLHAYTGLARAELAAKNVDAAKRAIDAALALPLRAAETFATAAAVAEAAGDDQGRARNAERARALNPRLGVAPRP